MSEIAISVENLSKSYRITHQRNGSRAPYKTLREEIIGLPKRLWSRVSSNDSGRNETFWALKDVSFDIKEGEVVGIIGRNGAGKSTLLKILSRITEPTSGEAKVYGRVGSLLEVGTGFHQELTGRENIFLNGALLGMSRAEIRRRFEEIVAFAEVEKFLDTPVKRYSSGMYVRLAFAVAAHLDTEILLIDEVLAVGDTEFQKKCLSKMEDVSRHGRTVLFVSHSMPAITRLCRRVILVTAGKIEKDDSASIVAATYISGGFGRNAKREWQLVQQKPESAAQLRMARIVNRAGQNLDVYGIDEEIGIEITFEVLKPGYVLIPNYVLSSNEGQIIFFSHDWDTKWRRTPRAPGTYIRVCWIPANFMSEGTFIVGVAVTSYSPFYIHSSELDALAFQVVDNMTGETARGDYAGPLPGAVRPLLPWTDSTLYRNRKEHAVSYD